MQTVPVVGGSVEDENVIEVFSLVILSSEDNQIAVQRVHGVPVPCLGTHSLWLQLHPLQLAHPFQIDLPNVVEVEAGLWRLYLAVL